MIERVTIRNFKRFSSQTFDLAGAVVLAGPNNAGKSTLLQAIVTWKSGLERWLAQRRRKDRRSGASITRTDFTAVPLREMNLLWEDRRIMTGGKQSRRRLIEIVLEGRSRDQKWECGLEFDYANSELIYVRPLKAKNLTNDVIQQFPPPGARDLEIVHVPPLSGIERDEQRHDRGMQDLLVGQGRPGEILRNLLWEIAAKESKEDWRQVAGHIRDLFGIELQEPSYSPARPFIVCEYKDPGTARALDLSNAGSGTLQVLLLLAFLYSRPATVILLDEPDAHQHVILQKQTYELIRKVARERQSQVIVATHSEVILDATEPARICEFFSDAPRPLTGRTERDRLREALKRVTTTDLLHGRGIGAVLYVEGETDEKILGEWARILNHPSQRFFKRPFVHWLRGRSLREARAHFFALRAAFPKMRGLCLLDGDNLDKPDKEIQKSGLVVLRWQRYEIENYLLQPDAVKRFADFPLSDQAVEKAFRQHVPEGADLFGNHVSLGRVKASNEFLVPMFEKMGFPTPKKDLYLLAAKMEPQEIHPEAVAKLDRIGKVLCPQAQKTYAAAGGRDSARG